MGDHPTKKKKAAAADKEKGLWDRLLMHIQVIKDSKSFLNKNNTKKSTTTV